MSDLEVPVEALRAAGQASTAVADGVRRVDLSAPATTLAAALPGGATQQAGTEAARTWAAAITSAARPTSEQIVPRYEQMLKRIRDRLDAEIGPFPWSKVRKGGDSTCGFDFPNMGGRKVALPSWGFEGNLPDADWPRAQQIFAEIAAEYSFAGAGLQIDQPGRHQTSGIDTALGAQYDFGTQLNTSMQVTTGCHPHAAG